MGSFVYGLCAVTSILCTIVLLSSYRRTPTRLLLLTVLCFCGLALNNLLLFADFAITGTTADLSLPRNLTAAGSVLLLLVGLIWSHSERD